MVFKKYTTATFSCWFTLIIETVNKIDECIFASVSWDTGGKIADKKA